MFSKPISIALSPNVESEDIRKAWKILFQPHLWITGSAEDKVISWFQNFFQTENVFFVDSGRTALYIILKSYGITTKDEVILQAFTCVVVTNAILYTGAKPIYVDILDNYTMNPKDLLRKISERTKAVIIQHTFGIPANIEIIKEICQEKGILLIEDCAHSLGAKYKGKKLGKWGDAAIFSFGRDKVISSVFGGAGIFNNYPESTRKKFEVIINDLPHSNKMFIFQQLFHPVAFQLIIKLYNLGIGKIILVFLQKLKLLSFPLEPEEKKSLMINRRRFRYPNALAELLLIQLKKLNRYNEIRQRQANLYRKILKKLKPDIIMVQNINDAIFHRFPIQVNNPIKYLIKAKARHVLLGDWYHNVVDPEGTDLIKAGYQKGSCPKAEYLAKSVINLPTGPNVSDDNIKYIAEIFSE